jgi:hypothetical protein
MERKADVEYAETQQNRDPGVHQRVRKCRAERQRNGRRHCYQQRFDVKFAAFGHDNGHRFPADISGAGRFHCAWLADIQVRRPIGKGKHCKRPRFCSVSHPEPQLRNYQGWVAT